MNSRHLLRTASCNRMKNRTYIYHILAVIVVSVWGTTFVSTKVLLAAGLSPAVIFAIRFALAYVGIWFFPERGGRRRRNDASSAENTSSARPMPPAECRKRRIMARSWRDELLFAALGVTGGSLYFIAENEALVYSQASNVAFIVCSTPAITMLMMHFMRGGERLTLRTAAGSLLSLAGVAVVVFNGCTVLRLNPAGDMLALGAALLWALYTLILRRLDDTYSVTMITRKTFFYGLVTLLPLFAVRPPEIDTEVLLRPAVVLNLLFLGVAASLLCYAAWSLIVKKIGSTRTTNYLYINPVVATVTSAALLGERFTLLAAAGAAMILVGIWMVEARRPVNN